jgi:hypothetical protein
MAVIRVIFIVATYLTLLVLRDEMFLRIVLPLRRLVEDGDAL